MQHGVYQQLVYIRQAIAMPSKDLHPSVARLYQLGRDHGDDSPVKVARHLNVSIQTLKNWETRGISKDGANKAARTYGCDPLAILDGPLQSSASMAPLSRIPRKGDDEEAIRIGMESLALAVFRASQGAASIFLGDVVDAAKARHFSTEHGFLAGLVGIARGVQSEEATRGKARRRADSAEHTKPGK